MIDKKGRLFGKINIVDLLVILLVLVVAAVLCVKFLGKSGLGEGPATRIRYTVLVKNVEPEVYENLKDTLPGQLMASGSVVEDSYVVGVTAQPQEAVLTLKAGNDGQVLALSGPDNLDLIFTVEAKVTNTVTFECGKQEIRVGKNNIVKTVDFELNNGIILSREIISE